MHEIAFFKHILFIDMEREEIVFYMQNLREGPVAGTGELDLEGTD